jgi:YggT family protein
VGFVQVFIGTLFFLLWLLVLGRIFLSWFDPTGSSALGRFLVQSTEWLLGPVRRVLPQTGAMDFSGLIVLLVLSAIWSRIL